jgi:hypothetical protein
LYSTCIPVPCSQLTAYAAPDQVVSRKHDLQGHRPHPSLAADPCPHASLSTRHQPLARHARTLGQRRTTRTYADVEVASSSPYTAHAHTGTRRVVDVVHAHIAGTRCVVDAVHTHRQTTCRRRLDATTPCRHMHRQRQRALRQQLMTRTHARTHAHNDEGSLGGPLEYPSQRYARALRRG